MNYKRVSSKKRTNVKKGLVYQGEKQTMKLVNQVRGMRQDIEGYEDEYIQQSMN